MGASEEGLLRDLLAQVVPGSQLREGLERILRARMGALIVIGDGPEVLRICSGGFHLDTEMTPQRLSELAKMDGAIVLGRSTDRIAWANVHLVPDPTVATKETGTRHRTAERVARSVDVPVVAVSEEMGTITLYRRHERRQLQPTDSLAARAIQLLRTLERFKRRFDDAESSLSAAELEDVVTIADVATVLQQSEMILRVASTIADLLQELGGNGRLLRVELDELVDGVSGLREAVLVDYLDRANPPTIEQALERLAALTTDELLALGRVAAAFAGDLGQVSLETLRPPRGVRLLRRLPQLSDELLNRLIEQFGDLDGVLGAPIDLMSETTGMTEDEARALKIGIAHLAETSLIDRYT